MDKSADDNNIVMLMAELYKKCESLFDDAAGVRGRVYGVIDVYQFKKYIENAEILFRNNGINSDNILEELPDKFLEDFIATYNINLDNGNSHDFNAYASLLCIDKLVGENIEESENNYTETHNKLIKYAQMAYCKYELYILPSIGRRILENKQDSNGHNDSKTDGEGGWGYSLNNFLFVKGSRIKKYKLNEMYVDSLLSEKRNSIRIGFSPLTHKKCIKTENIIVKDALGNDVKRINVGLDVAYIEELKQLIIKSIEQAAKDEVDILFFPELLCPPEICSQNKGYNLFLYDVFEELRRQQIIGYPKIIALPSVWQHRNDGSGQGDNKLIICDGMGKLLGEQYKHNRFEDYHGRAVENINTDDKSIFMLSTKAWGRIAFAICADVLYDYLNCLLQFKPSIIICPSFSRGSDAFCKVVVRAATEGCCIVWGNSFAAKEYSITNTEKCDDGDYPICVAGMNARYGRQNIKHIITAEQVKKYKDGESCLVEFNLPFTYVDKKDEVNWIEI